LISPTEESTKKLPTIVGSVLALALLTAMPAAASTVTRTVVLNRTTITCVVTYTDMNGNGRIDTFGELRSITDVVCTATRS
jgi:hypothetical protein